MITVELEKRLHSAAGPLQLQVSFTLETGVFATLYGPSGAGKTSILRMLAGLTEAERGRIVVDGLTWFDSASGIALPPQQRGLGFVFQDYALFPNLSVEENIAYALDGKGKDKSWLQQLLEMTGLEALRTRMPSGLSGGQKQRVALARALARRPRLLLLDEPLSALGSEMRTQLQDQLLQMHREFGLTTILVSHDMGEVFKLSQQVLCLEQGRITRSGSPAEVFLQHRLQGRVNLHAQVLAIRREDIVYILSLLIGQDIVEIIASEEEVQGLQVGSAVAVSAKAFSPMILPGK
jgi:molybdate transport system ATP-binding protein